MKRTFQIAIITVAVFLHSGYFFYKWFFNQPCEPPAKPKNVPAQAGWFGGCDGGNWIQLVSVADGKYRFKIYRDWDGTLQMDANFETEGCRALILNHSNFSEVIAFYNLGINNGIRLEVDSKFGQDNCHLKMLSPAYAGEDWEIIKEKNRP